MNGQATSGGISEYGERISYPFNLGTTPIVKGARDISITCLLRGYSVKVGCQSIAFETAESMCRELLRYYKNPAKVEEEYLATK